MRPAEPKQGPAVALLTGAGGAIGRATAIHLAKDGWRLGLLGRTASKLDATVDALGENNPGAITHPCDLADPESVVASVDELIDRFGRLDAVINIAGISPQVPIADLDASLIQSVLAQNLSGHLLLVATAWPMLAACSGCVVNVSSMASIDPYRGFTAYAASKSGLDSLTRSIMSEADDTGIRAFTLNPGAVETPLLRGLFDESMIAREATLHPNEVAEEILACLKGERDHRIGEPFPMVNPSEQAQRPD